MLLLDPDAWHPSIQPLLVSSATSKAGDPISVNDTDGLESITCIAVQVGIYFTYN